MSPKSWARLSSKQQPTTKSFPKLARERKKRLNFRHAKKTFNIFVSKFWVLFLASTAFVTSTQVSRVLNLIKIQESDAAVVVVVAVAVVTVAADVDGIAVPEEIPDIAATAAVVVVVADAVVVVADAVVNTTKLSEAIVVIVIDAVVSIAVLIFVVADVATAANIVVTEVFW